MSLKLQAMYFVGIALVTLFTLPIYADAGVIKSGFLTEALQLGSSGEQVELLQSWLANEPAIYPEAKVTGVYDLATENAVKKYQERQGVISKNVKHGSVGPITRATLNAEYSDQQGGIAWVEGKYTDVLVWNGSEFVPSAKEFDKTGPGLQRISAWVYPLHIPDRTSVLFEIGDGYGVGFEKGKIYARSPKNAEVITESSYITVGKWQHVLVIFADTYVDFVHNNYGVERGILLAPQQSSFWSNLFSFFIRPDTSTTRVVSRNVTVVKNEGGVFGRILGDFATLFRGGADEYIVEKAPVLAEHKIVPQTSATSAPARTLVVQSHPKPTSTLPNTQKSPVKKKPIDTSVVPPNSSSTTSPVSTSTTSLGPIIISTSTATSSATFSTSTSTSTSMSTSTTLVSTSTASTSTSTGGGGGGGSASLVNQKPVIALLGSGEVTIATGASYTDPGATATDAESGNLTSAIVVSGQVNAYLPGTYTVTYNVTDTGGEVATQVTRTVTVTPPATIPTEMQEPNFRLAAAGESASYSISSGSSVGPRLVTASINPVHVYVGQTQTLTVTVQSASPVVSVQAYTQLDNQSLTLNLQEVGTDGSGTTYSVSWVVFDTHVRKYNTTFTATNQEGQSNSVTLAWSDPCAGITQGVDSAITSHCTVGVFLTDGLDGANLTINNGVTLTLDGLSHWVWNPGTSITVNGSIVISKSFASMMKGYLFYLGDPPTEGFDQTAKYYFSTTPQSGYTRVKDYSESYYNAYFEASYHCSIC